MEVSTHVHICESRIQTQVLLTPGSALLVGARGPGLGRAQATGIPPSCPTTRQGPLGSSSYLIRVSG